MNSGIATCTDSLIMLNVKSTESKEDRTLLFTKLNLVITKIKILCNANEVAIFEFYF